MRSRRLASFIMPATLVTAGLAASLVLSACGSGGSNVAATKNKIRGTNGQLGTPNSINVTSQTSKGFVLIVKRLSLIVKTGKKTGSGGYVAIATDVAGKPGNIIGYAKVVAGISNNVKVTVGNKLTSGTYFFLLYPSGASPTNSSTSLKKTLAKVTVN